MRCTVAYWRLFWFHYYQALTTRQTKQILGIVVVGFLLLGLQHFSSVAFWLIGHILGSIVWRIFFIMRASERVVVSIDIILRRIINNVWFGWR